MKQKRILPNHIITILMSIVLLVTAPSFHIIAGVNEGKNKQEREEQIKEEAQEENALAEQEKNESIQRTEPKDFSNTPDELRLSIVSVSYQEEGMEQEVKKQRADGQIDLSDLNILQLKQMAMELSFEAVKSMEKFQLLEGDTFQYKISNEYLTLENTSEELPVTLCRKENDQKGTMDSLNTIGTYTIIDHVVMVTITDDTYIEEADQIFGILKVPVQFHELSLSEDTTSTTEVVLSGQPITFILPPVKGEKQERTEEILPKKQQQDLPKAEEDITIDTNESTDESEVLPQTNQTIPTADDNITTSVEFNLRWRDNNSPTRPDGADLVGIKIYFQLDGGEETELTEDTMGLIGLTELIDITKTVPGVDTTIYRCEGLLTEYDGRTITYRIENTVVPDGYLEYKNDGITYYIKTYDFQAKIIMNDGSKEDGPDLSKLNIRIGRADGSYETISVSSLLEELNLQDVDVCQKENNKTWNLKIPGLPKYAIGKSGAVIVELVSILTADDSLKTPQANGDYCEIEYDNTAVANFGTEITKCHNGGVISLTLKGMTEYEATKIWLDDGEPQTIADRPNGTFFLWRYTKTGTNDYRQASQVYYSGGSRKGKAIQKDIIKDQTKYNFTMVDYDDSETEISLPKYDQEGDEYVYCVRENLDGKNYEAVYIESLTESDGKITGIVPDNRDATDIYVYNHGIMGNRKCGEKRADLKKTWRAASEQSNLSDVQMTFKLQSKSEGETAFTDVVPKKTAALDHFLPETLTQTVEFELSAYDSLGIPVEYQWVEESIMQGTTDIPLISEPIEGHPERQVFILQYENGREVKYESYVDNGITVNHLIGTVDYEVDKYWWDSTTRLFVKTTPDDITDLTVYLYQNGKRYPDASTVFTMDGKLDPGGFPEDSAWHLILKDLPKYDEYGREYTYKAEEKLPDGWAVSYDFSAKNKTKMYNMQGEGGNLIRIEKNWIDDDDLASRKEIEVGIFAAQTIYDRSGTLLFNLGDKIDDTTINEEINWCNQVEVLIPYNASKVRIDNKDAFYVRETYVGGYSVTKDINYPNKPGADAKDTVATTQKPSDYKYEITYESPSNGVYIITNRRIGTVDITVTKKWIDQGVDRETRPDAELRLHIIDGKVTLEKGTTKDSLTIYDAYGKAITTDITDADLKTGVKAIQSIQKYGVTVDDECKTTYYFFNLPKYDEDGAVIHYDVEEVITNNQNDYEQVEKRTDYQVLDNVSHTHDTQKITYTNQRIGKKDIVFYKVWKDVYMYKKGKRPDIFLELYAKDSEHIGIYAVEVYKPRQWTPESPETIYNWECKFPNLNKYDENGQEIEYYVKEVMNVNLTDFDYLNPIYYEDYSAELIAEDENGDPLNLAPENGTIVNTLQKSISFNGKKVWKNIPTGFMIENLPDIKVELLQKIEGEPDTQWSVKDTITTIDNPDRFLANGTDMYSFSFIQDNEGNKYQRYSGTGAIYEYVARETILDKDGTELGIANIIYENCGENTTVTSDFTLENVFDISREDMNAKGEITVQKLWDNFPDGGTYPVVSFTLYRKYGTNAKEKIETKTLNANTGQTEVVFEKLLLYAPNGTQYRYSVEETGINGYEIRVLDGTRILSDFAMEPVNRDSGIINPLDVITDSAVVTFLNTYDPGNITSLEGIKTWNDFNNAFGTRPAELNLTLSRKANAQTGQNNNIPSNQVMFLMPVQLAWDKLAAGSWSYKVTGLEKYAPNGMPWIYTMTEAPVSQYMMVPTNGVAEQSSYNVAANIITMNMFTNSLYKSAQVNKIWDDGDDPYGLRPPQIYVKLQVSEDDGITYQDAVSYFATWVSGDIQKDTAINQLTEAITAKNNSKINNNINTITYTGLPAGVYKSGVYTKLRYQVIETILGNAFVTYDNVTGIYENSGAYLPFNDNPAITAGTGGSDLTKITNTLDEKVTLDVEKNWEDQNNVYSTRPDKIILVLQRRYAGDPNEPFVDALDTVTGQVIKQELSASANPSTISFPYLQKYDEENKEYEYSVRELINGATPELLNNYTVARENSSTQDQSGQTISYKTTLTNTLKTVNVSGTKKWEDSSNVYITRPTDIILNLFTQTESAAKVQIPFHKTPAPVWSKEENIWTYTFLNLPKYNKEGESYTYSVEEVPIENQRYVTSYDTNCLNITNKLTSISISKVDKKNNMVNDVELTIYHVDALNQKGAVAAVWDRDSSKIIVSKVNGKIMTGADAGKLIGLAAGRYVLSETRRPLGYVASDDIYFTLDEKNEVKITNQAGMEIAGSSSLSYDTVAGYTIIVVNVQKPVPITIKKYWDETADPIKNVYFEIYRYTSEDKTTSKKETISGQSVFKTNEAGNLLLDNGNEIFLDEGSYYLKEILGALSPSNAYIDPANKTEFQITEADLIAYEGDSTWEKQIGIIYNTVFQSKLSLYKYDPKNPAASRALSGVSFKLVRVESGMKVPYGGTPANSGNYVTDTQGKLTMELNNKGTYRLYEETPLQGYQYAVESNGYICEIYIDDEDYNKTVELNKTNAAKGKVSVNSENSLLTDAGLKNERYKGSVTLHKVDGESNSKLNGVIFKIYKKQENTPVGGEYQTGNYYEDYTSVKAETIETGSLKISGLEWGDYYIVETRASDGYIKTDEKYYFTIDETNAKDGIDLAVGNNAIKNYKNSLTITKQDWDTKAPLDGVMFRVINDSNGETNFLIDNNVATAVKSGTKNSVTELSLGTLVLRGLKAGTYTIQEIKPLDGYRKNKDFTFSIDDRGDIKAVDYDPMYQVNNTARSITITNKISTVTIKKTDLTGNVLQDATFSLYRKNEKTPVFTGVTLLDGTLHLTKIITSSDTLKDNKGVPEIWYKLEEAKAPLGYQKMKDCYLYLGEDNVLYQTSQKPDSDTKWKKVGKNSVKDPELNIKNEETIISFTKVGRVAEDCSDISFGAMDPNTVQNLEGVTFTIFAQEDPDTPLKTAVSDENGVVRFTNMPYGSYMMKETTPKKGYLKNDTVYLAEIDSNGSFKTLTTKGNKPVKDNQVVNDVPRKDIMIHKVSETNKGKVLPGATYGLFKKNPSTGEQQLIAKAVTDEGGNIVFQGVLMNVEYIIQELEAPDGSYVSQNPVKITYRVDENGNVILAKFDGGSGTAYIDPKTGEVVWLEPPVVVKILKKDDKGTLLSGAKLEIKDQDGNVVDTWVSSEQEGHTIEGILIPGNPYTLTELKAPAGYATADQILFIIEKIKVGPGEDVVVEVVMVDKEIDPDHPTEDGNENSSDSDQGIWNTFVKTGDKNNMILLVVLILLSLVTMLFTGYLIKKKIF